MTEPQWLFEQSRDGAFVASELTRGPWGDVQHGGPPSALLVRAMELEGPHAEAFVTTRVSVELLRPVPIAPLHAQVEVVRDGRRVRWLAAALYDGPKEVARARATRVRATTLELPPPRCPPLPPIPPPSEGEPMTFPFFPTELGYHVAVDTRLVEGRWGAGPAAMWIRARTPLVGDEPMTGAQRVMLAADAANGVCPVLDTQDWTFINPDLTVHLHRPLHGSWVGLRARSSADASGAGLVDAEIHDEAGACGRALLSLVVGPRAAAGR